MEDGRIKICKRSYQFLFSTPELFRNRTLCFFQPSRFAGGKQYRSMQLLNRVCRTQLTTNGIMTHWATQRFLPSILCIKGSSIKFKELSEHDLYTEGVGMMPWKWSHHELYNQLLTENGTKLSQYRLDVAEYTNGQCPTLVRFAYKGYFGVLTLNPNINEEQFLFRKSMKRYRFQQSDDMEIYEFSNWKPAYLKPNVIFVLQSLGVDVQVIYQLVKNRMKLLNHARYNDTAAIHYLSNLDSLEIPAMMSTYNGYSFNRSVWIQAFKCGLLKDSEVFFKKILRVNN